MTLAVLAIGCDDDVASDTLADSSEGDSTSGGDGDGDGDGDSSGDGDGDPSGDGDGDGDPSGDGDGDPSGDGDGDPSGDGDGDPSGDGDGDPSGDGDGDPSGDGDGDTSGDGDGDGDPNVTQLALLGLRNEDGSEWGLYSMRLDVADPIASLTEILDGRWRVSRGIHSGRLAVAVRQTENLEGVHLLDCATHPPTVLPITLPDGNTAIDGELMPDASAVIVWSVEDAQNRGLLWRLPIIGDNTLGPAELMTPNSPPNLIIEPITNDGQHHYSADGSTMAFVARDTGGDNQVFVAMLDNPVNSPVQLSSLDSQGSLSPDQLHVLPDGSKVVYRSTQPWDDQQGWSVDLEVPNFPVTELAFSDSFRLGNWADDGHWGLVSRQYYTPGQVATLFDASDLAQTPLAAEIDLSDHIWLAEGGDWVVASAPDDLSVYVVDLTGPAPGPAIPILGAAAAETETGIVQLHRADEGRVFLVREGIGSEVELAIVRIDDDELIGYWPMGTTTYSASFFVDWSYANGTAFVAVETNGEGLIMQVDTLDPNAIPEQIGPALPDYSLYTLSYLLGTDDERWLFFGGGAEHFIVDLEQPDVHTALTLGDLRPVSKPTLMTP